MKLEDLQPTIVFKTYWRFAAERHTIYERRLQGLSQFWTTDSILSQYKFTNAFRASDRVSQHLIRHVIYQSGGSMDDEEVVFRILLFKLFNSIPASNALKAGLGGVPSWQSFDEKNYGRILGEAKARGVNIWNAAYTQNQLYRTDLKTKHERYLALIKHMMNDGVTRKLKAARTYEEAYLVLRTYPIHGEFIAMQHLTDINYSPVINFSENDFIVAGPGALDGMQKCFGFRPDAEQAAEIIEMCVDEQKRFFRHFGLEPVTLFGRPLTLIDAQNLFCETDKYAREAHPEFNLERTEIKQKFSPIAARPLPVPFFPPKWGIKAIL